MSHQTHYRSYRGRIFTGQMTQPTESCAKLDTEKLASDLCSNKKLECVCVNSKQYRGLSLSDFVFQTVQDVLSFQFRDATMLGGSVAGQKYPQYYC